MKIRIIVFLAISAIITLSFSFTSLKQKHSVNTEIKTSHLTHGNEPVGGFLAEDKF